MATNVESAAEPGGGPQDLGGRAWSVTIVLAAGGPLLALGIGAALPPEGLDGAAMAVAGVTAWMAWWWVAHPVPRGVTALLPVLVLPFLDVLPMATLSGAYLHPLLLLMLGGFVLGHAMARVGLHTRLTALLLQPGWVRAGPRRVLLALMAASAVLSALVSNTATVVMMLPLATGLAAVGAPGAASRARGPAFALGLAYASSVGGMTTLVGTPPNAVLAGLSEDLLGVGLGFATWMGVGLPAALLLLPAAWFAVVRTFGLGARFERPVAAPRLPAAHPGERPVLWLVGIALLLWLTRTDKVLGGVTLPGWGGGFPGMKGSELDAAVALGAAVLVFLLPGTAAGAEGRRRLLVGWPDAERAIPWSVILLLGGGFALARAIEQVGLTPWVAGQASGLAGQPAVLVVAVVCAGLTFVTEFTSNTATAQITLPILAELAPVLGLAPLSLMVPATLSASCAFMMPVATAPNALASEAGGVSTADMVRAGVIVNLVGVIVCTGVGVLWVPWWLGTG